MFRMDSKINVGAPHSSILDPVLFVIPISMILVPLYKMTIPSLSITPAITLLISADAEALALAGGAYSRVSKIK